MEAFKNKLTNYELFVTAKYLPSLDDLKNLVLTSPKNKWLFNRLKFNPISFYSLKELELFPTIETYHVYTIEDFIQEKVIILKKKNIMKELFGTKFFIQNSKEIQMNQSFIKMLN